MMSQMFELVLLLRLSLLLEEAGVLVEVGAVGSVTLFSKSAASSPISMKNSKQFIFN